MLPIGGESNGGPPLEFGDPFDVEVLGVGVDGRGDVVGVGLFVRVGIAETEGDAVRVGLEFKAQLLLIKVVEILLNSELAWLETNSDFRIVLFIPPGMIVSILYVSSSDGSIVAMMKSFISSER